MQVYSHVVLGKCSEKYPSMHYSVFSTQHTAHSTLQSALSTHNSLYVIRYSHSSWYCQFWHRARWLVHMSTGVTSAREWWGRGEWRGVLWLPCLQVIKANESPRKICIRHMPWEMATVLVESHVIWLSKAIVYLAARVFICMYVCVFVCVAVCVVGSVCLSVCVC